MSSSIQIIKSCLFCGGEFTAKTLHTRYCSHPCNQKHYKQVKRGEKVSHYTKSVNTSTLKAEFEAVQQKTFLSLNEAALLLGASIRTIQRIIANGDLKVGKLGSRIIIQRTEIDKLFK